MDNVFTCRICNKEFKAITPAHLGKHGVTIDEYKMMYPETKFHNVSDSVKNKLKIFHTGLLASQDTKDKMSKTRKGMNVGIKRSQETIEHMTGWKHTEETKRRLSNIACNRSDEVRQNMSLAQLGKVHTDEHKNKISVASKRMWSNPEFKSKTVLKIAKATIKSPSSYEIKLGNILNEVCPNEYKFVGDGKSDIQIGNLIPDFINVKGKKLLIEMFGDYHHDPTKYKGLKWNKTEQGRTKIYNEYGYDVLIIWGKELKDRCKLIHRIIEFNKMGSVK